MQSDFISRRGLILYQFEYWDAISDTDSIFSVPMSFVKIADFKKEEYAGSMPLLFWTPGKKED